MKKEKIDRAIAVMKALDSTERVQILERLQRSDLRPSQIEEILNATQPRIAYHLGILKKANLVLVRQGRKKKLKSHGQIPIYYCLNKEFYALTQEAIDHLNGL